MHISEREGRFNPVRVAEERFKKTRRQLRAMQRMGQTPPAELGQRLIQLDAYLVANTSYWNSHFGFKRDDEI